MLKSKKLAIGVIHVFAAIAASSLAVNTAQAAPSTLSEQSGKNVETQSPDPSTLIRSLNSDPLGSPSANPENTAQVTSVSQLSDVKPTDWAFAALQSLVERYGCIAGYPDRTYKGQRAMTRFEFAAGLNACLDKINEIISAGLADKVSKEDFAAVQKLQEEFAAELAALKGCVDALEAKTAQLEAQQFSTTTKLNATAIFALAGASGGNLFNNSGAVIGNGNTNVTFSGRVRLNFDTSFNGQDRLRTRLQAGNITRFDRAISTAGFGAGRMTRLAFDTNTDNIFELDKLFYRFPIGKQLTAWVGVRGLDNDDIFNTGNPFFESSDNGSLSRFGRYDPLLFRGPSGAGAGLAYKFNDQFALTAAYLSLADRAGDANTSNQGGLFGGAYTASIQLSFTPIRELTINAMYQRAFEPGSVVDLASGTGSNISRQPFGPNDTSSNRYGGQISWRVAKGFNISGWLSFADARQESGNGIGSNANLFNWAVQLAFPDLFAEGNLGGIIIGGNPKVTSISNGLPADPGSALTLDAQYLVKLSKNLSITPGFYVVFNPGNYSGNSSIFIGTIRTTFSF